ncbi:glutamyl-tRNA reductase [Paraneptunicella aestuarii]|uniref:glutamyl-tRNA reductase n=1 Tax=Paraneptunicella aestuarii TaxID=2831148 RepID=UPI001E336B1A|nr:glutamyl-tRNA reductase [Paraneptunicella aestuarii]UAA40185.1 glutamyl-tRNA reductase [Paraneptunicella aestuarii]
MSLVVFGINHNTAPVSLREKVAFSPDSLVDALRTLQDHPDVSESVILSTCNRTEVYVTAAEMSPEMLCGWLAEFHSLDQDSLWRHGYAHVDLDMVKHLMRVASGLDSLVLGEPQILGQLKQSFTSARNVGTVDSMFEQLFQKTFATAKRVRTETEIGANAVSVAFTAVQLAQHIFSSLSDSHILLVGAGETIELVATHLHEHGVKNITVANRTVANGKILAERFSGQLITLGQIPATLSKIDIVISSTASQLPIIGKGLVERALRERRRKPMLLIDLAVPRDIEEEVAELDDAYLYSVDDLQQIVEQNIASRKEAATEAEKLIAEQVEQFTLWNNAQGSVDMLRNYRQQSELQKVKLLEKALAQLIDGREPEQVVTELANKLTNSLIHGPTAALKKAAETQDKDTLALLQNALGLKHE